eukprot:CAMPEP_0197623168 /NCGR_PEP_ID=MMETSP1338-20131121/3226_1 /TAXON_ID=43686 ORGANISM="Pelagodinium beii, Strain RCC1491" /NCGR_SAMPLE_ID=MMETSP1338 /ASSEMBLY_ACC=CAM_ASM_000754 /LENGTH=309 /DNA_ID=CAMNT_0043193049 /DNA_START=71 /DNA_END=1000 /DNA_ORIENTATION=+
MWKLLGLALFGFGQAETACSGQVLLQAKAGRREPDQFDLNKQCYIPRNRTSCTKTLQPSIVLAGLPHSGSTSLAVFLGQHPSLSMGKCKEHHYWTLINSSLHWNSSNHGLSTDYPFQFEVDCEINHTFDATPGMFWLGNPSANLITRPDFPRPGKAAIQKIKDVLGADLRIVMVIRDPVDVLKHDEMGTGNKWIPSGTNYPSEQTWSFMCYASSLENWLAFYPRSNFLFVKFEEFESNQQGTLDELLNFMGVAPREYSEEELTAQGRRRSSVVISKSNRSYFHSMPRSKSCKERLENLTGLKFDWEGSE